jgi:Na+/H+ antiporter NhaD/arsenite permease-like protein
LQFQDTTPRYRGDDSILNRWQYLLMLIVGICGLWFVPTFHKLTLLPPFVGSLCVLSVLWILNELFNRTLFSSGRMVHNTNKPLALQYDTIQNLLFFMGIFLALGAMQETGKLDRFFIDIAKTISNVYSLSGIVGVLSAFFGNVTITLTSISLFASPEMISNVEFAQEFIADGNFWVLLSYTTAFGASLLTIGSVSGFSLMKMENVSFLWYVRHMTFKVVAGWLAGLVVYGIIDMGF